eukprot:scaffold1389_cov122-Cylindrotheca_fusiformis.AAC.1
MSKSSGGHPTDWSANESNNGMTHYDSSHGGDTPEPPVYVAPDVANREEKAVTRSKFLVFLVLLLAVSGAAAATYILMEEEQSNDFAVVFAGLASEVSTVARQRLDQIFSGLDAFSVFISSEVRADANSTWPFVTITDYSKKAVKISELFGFKTTVLALGCFVQEVQKEDWMSFVLESAPSWYQESLDNEGNKFTVDELMNVTFPFVHEYNYTDNFRPIPTLISGPVLPMWYRYPHAPGGPGWAATSYDFASAPSVADLYQVSRLTLRPSLGFHKNLNVSEGASYGQWVVDSQIVQPVVENGELVGILWLRLPWSEFFDNLNVDSLFGGMVAVIRSSCEIIVGEGVETAREISYSIDASGATFLG